MPGTGVHDHRNPCSSRPESAFTMSGIDVHHPSESVFTIDRNRRSSWAGTRNETLRAQMPGGTAAIPRGVGLALLMHEGLTTWLHAVRPCLSPSSPDITHVATRAIAPVDASASRVMMRPPPADMIPPAQHAEATRLIASLGLSAPPP